MKSPNARLPACRLAQQLCVNHEQLLGAVGDLMCKELLFVGINSNNAFAGLKFKNVCRRVCTCITPLRSKRRSSSLVARSVDDIPTLIAATGNGCLYAVSHSNGKEYSLLDRAS